MANRAIEGRLFEGLRIHMILSERHVDLDG
jgi:hypothetical protein